MPHQGGVLAVGVLVEDDVDTPSRRHPDDAGVIPEVYTDHRHGCLLAPLAFTAGRARLKREGGTERDPENGSRSFALFGRSPASVASCA